MFGKRVLGVELERGSGSVVGIGGVDVQKPSVPLAQNRTIVRLLCVHFHVGC